LFCAGTWQPIRSAAIACRPSAAAANLFHFCIEWTWCALNVGSALHALLCTSLPPPVPPPESKLHPTHDALVHHISAVSRLATTVMTRPPNLSGVFRRSRRCTLAAPDRALRPWPEPALNRESEQHVFCIAGSFPEIKSRERIFYPVSPASPTSDASSRSCAAALQRSCVTLLTSIGNQTALSCRDLRGNVLFGNVPATMTLLTKLSFLYGRAER
jgi:hypothetical protein